MTAFWDITLQSPWKKFKLDDFDDTFILIQDIGDKENLIVDNIDKEKEESDGDGKSKQPSLK